MHSIDKAALYLDELDQATQQNNPRSSVTISREAFELLRLKVSVAVLNEALAYIVVLSGQKWVEVAAMADMR